MWTGNGASAGNIMKLLGSHHIINSFWVIDLADPSCEGATRSPIHRFFFFFSFKGPVSGFVRYTQRLLVCVQSEKSPTKKKKEKKKTRQS